MKIIFIFIILKCFSVENDQENNKNQIDEEIFSESSCLSDESSKKSCDVEQKQETIKLYRWDPVEVGYEREIQLEIGKKHKLITKAINPPVFVVDDYLEDYECDHIKAKANEAGLFSSELHMDDQSLKSKDYTRYNLSTWASIFHNLDSNLDGKINIPEEIKKVAYAINHLYLNDEEVDELLKKFEIILTEKNGEKWVNEENWAKVNHGGILGYLADIREKHPRHKDRFSDQVWLNVHHETDKVIKKVFDRLEKVTRLPKEIVSGSEPIQVVRYMAHGHYHAHFDSQNKSAFPGFPCCHTLVGGTAQNCRICRYMTVLVFLNDVVKGGETAFPVADDPEYQHDEFLKRQKGDLYNLSKFCHNGSLVVTPKKGRMVMWYNHLMNEEGLLGILDPFSLHGGCDVLEGEKWIANNWIPAPEIPNQVMENVYKSHLAEDSTKYVFKEEELIKHSDL